MYVLTPELNVNINTCHDSSCKLTVLGNSLLAQYFPDWDAEPTSNPNEAEPESVTNGHLDQSTSITEAPRSNSTSSSTSSKGSKSSSSSKTEAQNVVSNAQGDHHRHTEHGIAVTEPQSFVSEPSKNLTEPSKIFTEPSKIFTEPSNDRVVNEPEKVSTGSLTASNDTERPWHVVQVTEEPTAHVISRKLFFKLISIFTAYKS